MADAKRCDRCGRFYIVNDKIAKVKGEIVGFIKLYDTRDNFIDSYDLCEDCCEELIKFLGEENG